MEYYLFSVFLCVCYVYCFFEFLIIIIIIEFLIIIVELLIIIGLLKVIFFIELIIVVEDKENLIVFSIGNILIIDMMEFEF